MRGFAREVGDGLLDIVEERLRTGIDLDGLECYATQLFLAQLLAVCILGLCQAFGIEE